MEANVNIINLNGVYYYVNKDGTCTAAATGAVTPNLDIYSVVAGAPVTQLDSLALNGNVAGDYLVDIGVTVAAGGAGAHLSILWNNTATNLKALCGDNKVGASSRTDWAFANTAIYPFQASTTLTMTGRISARTGRKRQIFVMGFVDDTNQDNLLIDGICTETAANLTKISILSSVAGALDIGTYIRLTPLNTSA